MAFGHRCVYAGQEIGPPLETLTWQKKAAQFHWSGWQNQAAWHDEAEEEDRSDDEDLDED